MNRYPAWLNALVVSAVLLGVLLALPNIYPSVPAVQMSSAEGEDYEPGIVDAIVRVLAEDDLVPEAIYIDDGRAVLRFESYEEQTAAQNKLRDRYRSTDNVALTQAPRLPDWLRNLGLSPMSLGLDLRGGVYVLLEVDMQTAIESRLESYQQSLSDSLRGDVNIRHRMDLDGQTITVRLQKPEDVEPARQAIAEIDRDLLLLDGIDDRSFRVRMSDIQIRARQDFAIEQNITTLRNRVNQLGVSEPLIQRQGMDRIVVQLPGVQDPNALDKILTATATLEFRLVDNGENLPGSRRYAGRSGIAGQILKRDVIASGDQIIDAESGFSGEGQPAVFITLDAAGGDNMLKTTRQNVNKRMSTVFIESKRETIMIDGKPTTRDVRTEEIINTAVIRGIFKDRFQTTGLTPVEARDLALLLRAGALAAPVYKVEERTIGPTLGQDNIDRGFKAVQIGFLAVIVFMALYYRWFGMIANLALFSNLVFIVALLSLLQASLTLPGIAGIVLTVGMAVDANVLIFERIREEVAAGNSPQASIHAGYEKALSSIADANITTLIAAIVLFAFGTGPIKGFAITLSLGIITSMFTAIIGTRAVVNFVFGNRRISEIPV